MITSLDLGRHLPVTFSLLYPDALDA